MLHILTNWKIEPYDDLNRYRKSVWQNSTPIWLLSLSKTAHNLSVGCVSPRASLTFWDGLYPVYRVSLYRVSLSRHRSLLNSFYIECLFHVMVHSWILSCVKPRTWLGGLFQELTWHLGHDHSLVHHFPETSLQRKRNKVVFSHSPLLLRL